MSRFNKITANVALPLAAAFFVLSAAGVQARMETPEEVEKILTFLETENCQIMRDAMGAKMLSAEEDHFVVESNCPDGNYTFTLDQDFKVLDKKPSEY